MKVGINGLGRIGRLLLRALLERYTKDIKVIELNTPSSPEITAHLLQYDSVHGPDNIKYSVKNNYIVANDCSMKFYSHRKPSDIPWNDLDIVFECSGQFNKKELVSQHKAKKVIVSAPCTDSDVTIIMGVNHKELAPNHDIISIGSCTTNAFAPLVKIFHDSLGIECGYVTTVHAYTNDQKLLDATHNKDFRRARSAGLSMIPTKTGAAKTIGNIIPELRGKISGSAIRVPVPNVSLVDFSFKIIKLASVEKIHKIVKEASYDIGDVIGIAPAPLVSADFNHSDNSVIYDPFETNVINNNFVRVLGWYDNEWAFVLRMLDAAVLLKKRGYI